MIFDQIGNLSRYSIPFRDEVVAFLKNPDLALLPVGEMEIKGRALFVRVIEYQTKPPEECRFETHQQYADIQLVLKGHERMQYVSAANVTPLGEYDEKNDIRFFETAAQISSFIVQPSEFAIFFPGEPHRPGCSAGDRALKVKKLVFKVRIE